jgi:hypothetical protein
MVWDYHNASFWIALFALAVAVMAGFHPLKKPKTEVS